MARRDPGLAFLALRVYVLLVIARGIITVFPLRRITAHLGTPQAETPSLGLVDHQLRYAHRVGWAMAKLSPHTPTTSNCYPQALTARWLLHRRGIPSTVYYGAAFETGRPALAAHVWVRCGPLVVTGGAVGQRLQALTSFADTPKRPARSALARALRSSRVASGSTRGG